MLINEFVSAEDDAMFEVKASRKLCLSRTPDSKLGASQLASCKSQGLRAHDTKHKYRVGKKMVSVNGKKVKGKRYGGPIPEWKKDE